MVYPPNMPAEVWNRFVEKVYVLPRRGHHLWTSPPRDDGYAQFWVPASVEGMLGTPERDEDEIPGSQPLPGLLEAITPAARVPDQGRPWRAHRVAWAAWYGPLAADDIVMHRCDQPLCVPVTREAVDRHLRLGDSATNNLDRERKNRTARRSRNGMLWGRADRRGPANRSLAIHQALAAALAQQLPPAEVAAVVAAADRAGSPYPGQLAFGRRPSASLPDRTHADADPAGGTPPLFAIGDDLGISYEEDGRR